MTLYVVPGTLNFYDDGLHATIPDGAVRITTDQHAALRAAQLAGFKSNEVVTADTEGNPVSTPAVPISLTTQQQIVVLERQITPRRLREAVLGADGGWLKAQDAKIAALRAQLPEAASAPTSEPTPAAPAAPPTDSTGAS
jgi:hypothetical protein